MDWQVSRNDQPVNIPADGLKLNDQITSTYRLFGVVDQEGTLNNGHYTSRVQDGERWLYFNDQKVLPTQLEQYTNAKGESVEGFAASSSAYLLFYIRNE